MVPDALPELFSRKGSGLDPMVKLLPAGFTVEMVTNAIPPPFDCSRIRSPTARAVLPVLMWIQEVSNVTVVVEPVVTIVPFGVGVIPEHPAPPPGVLIGYSFSQCAGIQAPALLSSRVLSA